MPSADLYARAIIAAALNYGDDPVAALEARSGIARRCLAPAITGLARGSKKTLAPICAALGYDLTSISRARSSSPERFEKAQASAEEAVRYALRTIELAQRQAPAAPRAPASMADVRQRQQARPKGRAVPRGATCQSLGNGVQVIRLKPIDEAILARARQQIARGVSVTDFADMFDVDAERLAAALQGEVAA